jgi:DNA-binding LacI/PurR family transcriptional regulator
MAVIGVDNTPAASLAAPPLTTIDFHPAALGRYLTAIVLGEIEGIPPPQDFLVETLEVVVRESG